MTGENSFIRLSLDGGATLSTRLYTSRHGRFIGRRKSVKKAYVSLIGDGDINFVEGVA